MKKIFTYLIFILLLAACEDVYEPEIEERENALVVDARIVAGEHSNFIKLSKTLNFNGNQSAGYPPANGARVKVIDGDGIQYPLKQVAAGMFDANLYWDSEQQYKLQIEYNGNVFESSFESVPPKPALDTVYGFPDIQVVKEGGVNSVGEFKEIEGVQLFADVSNEGEQKYYRFVARKIMQYTFTIMVPFMGIEIPQIVYAWKSYYPKDYFNIAAPGEYSAIQDVVRHPLYFMARRGPVTDGESFVGWILILHQYSLSESAYFYYRDLNKQLRAEGKLFDPMHVQARNNLKCNTDPNQLILGNFEISRNTEARYFVKQRSNLDGYVVKRIPYFYNISLQGQQVAIMPDFWEETERDYP